MANKYYNKNDFEQELAVEEPIAKEEAPIIEDIPVKKIEPKKEEFKPLSRGKVILITRDGCIVESKGNNISLYGPKYMQYKIGDMIEF